MGESYRTPLFIREVQNPSKLFKFFHRTMSLLSKSEYIDTYEEKFCIQIQCLGIESTHFEAIRAD